ncbi:MAG: hypothetical protein LBB26_01120 [Puniceicoccales bacterium]|jgi:hypothetical protein|nr:hypothetical protein [Puniceicoccales bacterium]
MKNTTDTAISTTDIFDDDCELQIFQTPGLTPGLRLEPSFSREFPTPLRQASPPPAVKAIQKISPTNKKTELAHQIDEIMRINYQKNDKRKCTRIPTSTSANEKSACVSIVSASGWPLVLAKNWRGNGFAPGGPSIFHQDLWMSDEWA